ncbi:MAG: hypothetical protein NZ849_02995 [Meiothermus sp.]|uniref:hypothetical protein n=1 Tax=Meiothermus sp. TaxID=1955249 RepID=UPI0025EC12C5|nr:hypothetical protein [Meiothermus sp.]MCS7059468.1 hypothetical protein [Meiothermus sp.]MCS7193868.1 hypothetical protein [Meiothermus sp.]MDW8090185.1 hypothetical protein [Meiothermus sp.]MDW8481487.1 hypothetical protein [Meiothermus sp.]
MKALQLGLGLLALTALSQSSFNIVEMHLHVAGRGHYLVAAPGATEQTVRIRGPQGEQTLVFQSDTFLELPHGPTQAQPGEGRRWLYDGRWFSDQGYWHRQAFELELATPVESAAAQAWIERLGLPLPLLVLEEAGRATLPPLTYAPEPGGVLHTSLWVWPGESQALDKPRLLENRSVRSGGLRSRGGFLAGPGELERLWRELGLGELPPARFEAKVGYFFSGLRAESDFRLKVVGMSLRETTLLVTLEASRSPGLTAQTNGVVLLFEAPPRVARVELRDDQGRLWGSY